MTQPDETKREWYICATDQRGVMDFESTPRTKAEAEKAAEFKNRLWWHTIKYEVVHKSQLPEEVQP